MNLIIVESPTKGNTIKNFLGSNYRVLSSYGHIRDLPKSELGVDIEKDFTPKYIIPLKARKIIKLLKEEVKKSELTILATDEDREGEAIAWHLTQALNLDGGKPYQRIVFHEITKSAIKEALKNPRKIDFDLVDAQQARRILDRIVGYKLSPFLWKKVARGLSAGRVQSVAVRLVVERERQIQSFIPQEYWTVEALLKKQKAKGKHQKNEFIALLIGSRMLHISGVPLAIKKDSKILDKLEIKNKKEAGQILKDLKGAEYKVINAEKKEVKRNPLSPFATSALQQEAWHKLRYSAKLTMSLAQNLYENGYITYHRTDSLNISQQALFDARDFIIRNYGQNYWAGYLRKFKTKLKTAQEAHEAIRPTDPKKSPQSIKEEFKYSKQFEGKLGKLYDLIWRRFIASQMAPSVFDSTVVDIAAKNYTFRTSGQMLKFDGFSKVYPIKFEQKELPTLEINEILELIKLNPCQRFTQPPPRYNEASLIKAMEENAIGRPSTYAPILSTIQSRNYIEKDENRRFQPTEIGIVVNDLLVSHFPEVVDIKFTAKMEEGLDEIAQGQKKWVPVIEEFYGPFDKNLKQKEKEIKKSDIAHEPTKKNCPKCGAEVLIRLGRFGKFYACSKFPECKYTESLKENQLGIKCPKCKKGKITQKRTKKGKIFYGCSNWPKCDVATWDKPTGEFCPKCQSLLVETKRKQIKCSNKDCGFHV